MNIGLGLGVQGGKYALMKEFPASCSKPSSQRTRSRMQPTSPCELNNCKYNIAPYMSMFIS